MAKFKTREKRIISYIPIGYEDDEKPLTFKARMLNARELAHFRDQSTRLDLATNQMIIGSSEQEYEVARNCILSWENMMIDDLEVKCFLDTSGKFDETLVLEIPDLFEIICEVGRHIVIVSQES